MLLQPMQRFTACRCTQHAHVGNDESSVQAQVWPKRFCYALAEGCEMLMATRHGNQHLSEQSERGFRARSDRATNQAYPTDARSNLTCKACRSHIDQFDHRHTRVLGECRFARRLSSTHPSASELCAMSYSDGGIAVDSVDIPASGQRIYWTAAGSNNGSGTANGGSSRHA